MEALISEVINVTAKIADGLNQYRRYVTRIYIEVTIAGSKVNHKVNEEYMSVFDVRAMIALCPENIRYVKHRDTNLWADKLYIELVPGATLMVIIPDEYEVHPEKYKKEVGEAK